MLEPSYLGAYETSSSLSLGASVTRQQFTVLMQHCMPSPGQKPLIISISIRNDRSEDKIAQREISAVKMKRTRLVHILAEEVLPGCCARYFHTTLYCFIIFCHHSHHQQDIFAVHEEDKKPERNRKAHGKHCIPLLHPPFSDTSRQSEYHSQVPGD